MATAKRKQKPKKIKNQRKMQIKQSQTISKTI